MDPGIKILPEESRTNLISLLDGSKSLSPLLINSGDCVSISKVILAKLSYFENFDEFENLYVILMHLLYVSYLF